ncbi:MAG: hypothetical protein QOJ63_2400 [Solirubrobacteraceae bacterium]|jgi:hypothetical protein|nr:hypothetical protein [Solirubrobacteraceae bacterium]
MPPFFVRAGTGALPNGWIPDTRPARDPALHYEVVRSPRCRRSLTPPRASSPTQQRPDRGEPTSRWFGNQLGLWLTNEAHPALATQRAVARDAASTEVFTPTGQ